MITINNQQYRNLEEQVLKNTDDIQLIQEQANIAELGIKVVSGEPLQNSSLLPADYDGEYGDAYLVGIETPYDLYIWTRTAEIGKTGNWFNFGPLNAPSIVPGPVGPQGIQGETGERGSKWNSQTGAPATTDALSGDQFLDTSTGNVYQFNGNQWQKTGNIQGPQGVQGIQGIQGEQGIQGLTGPQGPQGPMGQFLTIIGTLDSTNQLPTPTEEIRHYCYIINNAMYAIVGTDTLQWQNIGTFAGGTDVIVDGAKQEEINLSGIVQKPSLINYVNLYGMSNPITTEKIDDGIAILGGKTTGRDAANNNINMDNPQLNLPFVDSDSITISAGNGNFSFNISNEYTNSLQEQIDEAGAKYITITAPSTSTTGTLDLEQMAILQNNPHSYIMLNDEMYYSMDRATDSGYLVYTHVGEQTIGNPQIKCIYIQISTRTWTLTTNEVGGSSSTPFTIYCCRISAESSSIYTEFDLRCNIIVPNNDKSYTTTYTGLYNMLYDSGAKSQEKGAIICGAMSLSEDSEVRIPYSIYAANSNIYLRYTTCNNQKYISPTSTVLSTGISITFYKVLTQ